MNSRLSLLGIVLALQLILVAAFFLGTGGSSDEETLWLDVDVTQIDRMVVSGADDEVTLASSEDQWRMGELQADQDKVTSLLDKLVAMQTPWPVATSTSSQARFEVEADNHQRRVQLFSGDEQLADIYLGTSPGFQRVHARKAGEDEIFSVELSNYELPLTVDGWLDKALLSIAEPLDAIQLTLSSGEEHRLQQTDEGWLYNDAAADQDAAATYANRFKTLRVLNVASAEDMDDAVELGRIELRAKGTDRVLYVDQVGEDYLLRDAQRSYKVATYIAEQLLLTDVDLAAQAESAEQAADE